MARRGQPSHLWRERVRGGPPARISRRRPTIRPRQQPEEHPARGPLPRLGQAIRETASQLQRSKFLLNHLASAQNSRSRNIPSEPFKKSVRLMKGRLKQFPPVHLLTLYPINSPTAEQEIKKGG